MNFRLVAIAIYALAGTSCSRCGSKPAVDAGCRTEVLTAVHTAATPKLDGEGDEEAWLKAKPTRPFSLSTGGEGRPHTEVRASYDDAALYLLFYAGDEDLEADDFMGAEVTGANGKTIAFRVAPDGKLTGSGEVKFGVDADGSLADAGDDDEEWLVEAAIPWTVIGKTDEVRVRFSRRDKPKQAEPRELVWPEPCASGVIRLAR